MYSDDRVFTIAEKISCYLENHPHAADSVEGITKCWIQDQHGEESILLVIQALDYLEKQKSIRKNITKSGITIYSKYSESPDTQD